MICLRFFIDAQQRRSRARSSYYLRIGAGLPILFCRSPCSATATARPSIRSALARSGAHMLDEILHKARQITPARTTQQTLTRRPGVLQPQDMQGLGPAVARGAGPRHHGDTRARLDHATHRLETAHMDALAQAF